MMKLGKGTLRFINNPILNIDITESSIRIISCDHTINNIRSRALCHKQF